MKASFAALVVLFGFNTYAMNIKAEVSCEKRYTDRVLEIVHVKNSIASEEIYIIQHNNSDSSSVVIFQDNVVSRNDVITGSESRLVLLDKSRATFTIKAKNFEDLDGMLLTCEKDVDTSFDI